MEFQQGIQASSPVETCKSAFLLNCKSSFWFLAEFLISLAEKSAAFSRGVTGLSHLPLCFELTFGVTVESVQGNQVYLEWIGTSGSF